MRLCTIEQAQMIKESKKPGNNQEHKIITGKGFRAIRSVLKQEKEKPTETRIRQPQGPAEKELQI